MFLPPPAHTRARTTDPITSQQAAERCETLGLRYQQVLWLVETYPNRTAKELSSLWINSGLRVDAGVALDTPHRRLPELERMGLVKRSDTYRKCHRTGRNAYTWSLTHELPEAP